MSHPLAQVTDMDDLEADCPNSPASSTSSPPSGPSTVPDNSPDWHVRQNEAFQVARDFSELQALGLLSKTPSGDVPRFIVCGRPGAIHAMLSNACRVPLPTRQSDSGPDYTQRFCLSRRPPHGMVVTIKPGLSRVNPAERNQLRDFRREGLISSLTVSNAIQEAHLLLRGMTTTTLCDDILRVELRDPNATGVTLLDVPGFRDDGSMESLSPQDMEILKGISERHVRDTDFILAAFSTDTNDADKTLRIALEFDPSRVRSLGILTYSNEQRSLFSALHHLNHVSRTNPILLGGWHILCEPANTTQGSPERDQAEQNFFNGHYWDRFHRKSVGIQQLGLRLQFMAHRQCNLSLMPEFQENVESICSKLETNISKMEERLEFLGEERETLQLQRAFLHKTGNNFSRITYEALNRIYTDNFFITHNDASPSEDHTRRLQDTILDLNKFFFQAMWIRGYRQHVIDLTCTNFIEAPRSNPYIRTWEPTYVARSCVEAGIEAQIERNSGSQFSSAFVDEGIASALFRDQSMPWEPLARHHLLTCWQSARYFVAELLEYLAGVETGRAIMAEVIEEKLETIKNSLLEKLKEILPGRKRAHPLPTARGLLKSEHYAHSNAPADQSNSASHGVSRAAAILQHVQAYYEVAIVNFMDNIAILAIENCLIEPLFDIFTGLSVNDMSNDQVEHFGQETSFSIRERNLLREDLEKFKSASKTVSRLTRPSLNPIFTVGEPNMEHALRTPEVQNITSLPNAFAIRSSGTVDKRAVEESNDNSPFSNKRVKIDDPPAPSTIGIDWSQSMQPAPEGSDPETLQHSYKTITADDRFAHVSQEELRLEDYRQTGRL